MRTHGTHIKRYVWLSFLVGAADAEIPIKMLRDGVEQTPVIEQGKLRGVLRGAGHQLAQVIEPQHGVYATAQLEAGLRIACKPLGPPRCRALGDRAL